MQIKPLCSTTFQKRAKESKNNSLKLCDAADAKNWFHLDTIAALARDDNDNDDDDGDDDYDDDDDDDDDDNDDDDDDDDDNYKKKYFACNSTSEILKMKLRSKNNSVHNRCFLLHIHKMAWFNLT